MLEKVAEDSPERCQAIYANGQCHHKIIPGSKFCPMHGGNKAVDSQKAASLRNYRLSKWQGRVNDFADNDKAKSLREEIGILRIVLEETVSRCGDPTELILASGRIADLVMKIEKIVTSCHKLEGSLGQMLDKQAAMQLSGEIVDIISNHVKDDSVVAAIANDIGICLARTGVASQDS